MSGYVFRSNLPGACPWWYTQYPLGFAPAWHGLPSVRGFSLTPRQYPNGRKFKGG